MHSCAQPFTLPRSHQVCHLQQKHEVSRKSASIKTVTNGVERSKFHASAH